jgi:hypothetical protein
MPKAEGIGSGFKVQRFRVQRFRVQRFWVQRFKGFIGQRSEDIWQKPKHATP